MLIEARQLVTPNMKAGLNQAASKQVGRVQPAICNPPCHLSPNLTDSIRLAWVVLKVGFEPLRVQQLLPQLLGPRLHSSWKECESGSMHGTHGRWQASKVFPSYIPTTTALLLGLEASPGSQGLRQMMQEASQ